jgi:hypothetical protein
MTIHIHAGLCERSHPHAKAGAITTKKRWCANAARPTIAGAFRRRRRTGCSATRTRRLQARTTTTRNDALFVAMATMFPGQPIDEGSTEMINHDRAF